MPRSPQGQEAAWNSFSEVVDKIVAPPLDEVKARLDAAANAQKQGVSGIRRAIEDDVLGALRQIKDALEEAAERDTRELASMAEQLEAKATEAKDFREAARRSESKLRQVEGKLQGLETKLRLLSVLAAVLIVLVVADLVVART